MTSVYGVTKVGARAQIHARLAEKLLTDATILSTIEMDKALFGASTWVTSWRLMLFMWRFQDWGRLWCLVHRDVRIIIAAQSSSHPHQCSQLHCSNCAFLSDSRASNPVCVTFFSSLYLSSCHWYLSVFFLSFTLFSQISCESDPGIASGDVHFSEGHYGLARHMR